MQRVKNTHRVVVRSLHFRQSVVPSARQTALCKNFYHGGNGRWMYRFGREFAEIFEPPGDDTRVRSTAMVDREHFDYYGYRARHNAASWLWLSPCDTCIVNTRRLAALYDRHRCKVKCASLRSALVYGICTSISMFRWSCSLGQRPTESQSIRAGQLLRKCIQEHTRLLQRSIICNRAIDRRSDTSLADRFFFSSSLFFSHRFDFQISTCILFST